MGTAWLPLSTYGNQQACVRTSHLKVVVDDGDCFQDAVEKVASVLSGPAHGELDPDAQLCDSDRSDGHIVLVSDHPVEVVARALGVDQEGRVEYEATQDRSSIATSSRVAVRSSSQALSGLRRRRNAFTSAP